MSLSVPTVSDADTLSGSHLAQHDLAEEAVRLALPSIEAALRSNPEKYGDSGFLHIVVMNPGLAPTLCSFEEAILYEYSLGDRSRWDADYAGFARAKARLSWVTGLDSHAVQTLRPYLLARHDTTLWGGVALDGLVVAASGAHPWYDEAFSGMVAMCLRALVKDAREREVRAPFLQ